MKFNNININNINIIITLFLVVLMACLLVKLYNPGPCVDDEVELETPSNISTCYAWAFKERHTCGAFPFECQVRHDNDMKLCAEHFAAVKRDAP
jgi:hypothetical protein